MRTNTFNSLDNGLSADGTYSGQTTPGTLGASAVFGDLLYLDPAASTWKKAIASGTLAGTGDARGTLGICVLAGGSGAPTIILLEGNVRADSKFPTMTVNAQMYVSGTSGLITGTQPVTTDYVIRAIGQAISATTIFFNPSADYITHT